MPDIDINDPFGIVDKRRGRGTTGTTHALAEVANLSTVGAMKARLTAISGTTYTAARLATMTENDLVYAIRVASADSAGI